MKINLRKSGLALTVGVFLFLGVITKVHAGIGVSPALVENKNLRPGDKVTQTIVISQSEPDEALDVVIEPEIGAANDWLTFTPGAKFSIPKGTKQFALQMTISPPAGADIKQYKGVIRVKATPKGSVAGGVTVVRGARIEVDFATTNKDYVELIVRGLDIDNFAAGSDLILKVKTENKGNIEAGPTKATIDVLDLTQKSVAKLSSDKIGKVQPSETKEVNAVFANTLKPGEYFAKTAVYYNNKKLREDRLVFTVTEGKPQDADKASGEVKKDKKINITVDKLVLNISLVILIIATGGIAFLMIRKRKKLTARQEQNLMIGISAIAMLLAILATIAVNYEALFTDKETKNTIEIRVLGITSEPGLTGNDYYIFAEPNENAVRLETAKEGQTYSVVEEKDGWYKLDLGDGKFGWIPENSVKATNKY